MKSSTIISTCSVIAISLLTSCGIHGYSVLQDVSCSPPCWKEITPGVTTEKEVIDILSHEPDIDPNSIRKFSHSPYYRIHYKFNSYVEETGGNIFVKGETVVALDFSPQYGNLRFSDAIMKFGEPEYVLPLHFTGEYIQLATLLLYPTQGVALFNIQLKYKGERAQISPDQRVEGFFYFDPTLFDEIMTDGIITRYPSEIIHEGMLPWKGYGEYEFIETDW